MDELLRILQTNALESRENIARMLGVPATDVAQRIAAYEKQGVIRGYQAILNEDQLDLDKVTAVIEVKVTPQREGGFDTIAELRDDIRTKLDENKQVGHVHLIEREARNAVLVTAADAVVRQYPEAAADHQNIAVPERQAHAAVEVEVGDLLVPLQLRRYLRR